jgi:hypothetical protein
MFWLRDLGDEVLAMLPHGGRNWQLIYPNVFVTDLVDKLLAMLPPGGRDWQLVCLNVFVTDS